MNFMIKKIVSFLATIAICILAVVAYSMWSSSYFKQVVKYGSVGIQAPKMPAVNCWGDSLTAGYMGNGVTYPKTLQQIFSVQLSANGYKASTPVVRNLGISGETSLEIACRGGYKMHLRHSVLMNKPGSPQLFEIATKDGRAVSILRLGDNGVNPVRINGITGHLSRVSGNNLYTFTPKYIKHQDTLAPGSVVTTYSATHYRSAIPVIFIGQNGGYESDIDLIRQQKAIIKNQIGGSQQYLIIGLHTGTAEQRAALEKHMQKAYGKHYINLRAILSKNGLKIARMKETTKDSQMMQKGMTPASLLAADGLHFNAKGYRIVARIVYARMDALGMIHYPVGAQSILKNYY
jgi:lysophospholipase L1-like esterase